MKLYVNEKLFSLHRKFYVKDEFDADSAKLMKCTVVTTYTYEEV